MKKIIRIAFLLSLCITLTACEANNYKKAEELLVSEDYKAALDIYLKLGDYEDSVSKAEMCEKEIGMTENADYSFLGDIEKSVLERMNASDSSDYSKLVNTELAYLEKYKDKEFYNNDLKLIALKYIEGLYTQKEALNYEYYSEFQVKWLEGYVKRVEALDELYKNYDFLSTNAEFIGSYIADLEQNKYTLNGYYAIEEDIGKQLSDEGHYWDLNYNQYTLSCTLTNNTEYKFGTYFEFDFIDSNGVLFESNTVYIDNIAPGMSYDVTVYISQPSRLETFNWSNYYEYVQ